MARTMGCFVQFTPEEKQFLASVDRFVEEFVFPNTRKWETDTFPPDIWKRCASLGITHVVLPKGLGGLGYSYAEMCRRIAQGDPALAMNVAAINALCVAHFDRFASDEQRAKYLPGILSGECPLAWGLTEPLAGSDARYVQTRATPIPDRPGFFHLNGEKMFTTNGGFAGLIIVIARLDDENLSAFLVEKDQPGVIDRGRIETVGVKASYTWRFEMKDAVGWHTPGSFEEVISLLYRGRVGIAGMALGIAEKALELGKAHARERVQFGRPLAKMQSVQNMIADSSMEIEAARLLVHKAARMHDEGMPIVKEASHAKLFASETARNVTNRMLQIFGGRGMMPEYLVEKLWRDAKLTEIGEGASEIQRLIIAKQELG